MYDKGFWPTLRQALDQAFGGDGSGLMGLADIYADRSGHGHLRVEPELGDLRGELPGPARRRWRARTVKAELPTFEQAAPTWGRFLAWSEPALLVLAGQGDRRSRTRSPPPGSPPIVVVGTTRDPATPYAWAQGWPSSWPTGT